MSKKSKSNKPVATVRYGAMKATIWKNDSDNGAFYSVNFSRTYEDANENLQDADSFSGTDLLKLSRLSEKAYTKVGSLRAADKAAAEDEK